MRATTVRRCAMQGNCASRASAPTALAAPAVLLRVSCVGATSYVLPSDTRHRSSRVAAGNAAELAHRARLKAAITAQLVRCVSSRALPIGLLASLRGILRNSPASVSAVASPAPSLRLSQPSLGVASHRAPSDTRVALPVAFGGYCGTRPPASVRLHLPHHRCGYLSPASDYAASRCAAASCIIISCGRPPTPPRVHRASCALCASRASQAPRLRCHARCQVVAARAVLFHRRRCVCAGRRGRCYASLLLPALGLAMVPALSTAAAASPARGRCRCLLSQPVPPRVCACVPPHAYSAHGLQCYCVLLICPSLSSFLSCVRLR